MKYIKKDSLIHRINARSKLLSILVIAVISLIKTDIIAQGLLFFLVFLVFKISKIDAHTFIPQFRFMKVLGPIIILLNGFLHPEEGILIFKIFGFAFTTYGIIFGIIITLRVLNISSVFFLYANTTSSIEIASAINKFGASKETAITLILSLRNIPLVKRDIDLVMDSMKSKGIGFSGITGLKNYFLMLIPVLTSILERAERQSISLEIRDFAPDKVLKKGFRRWNMQDTVLICLSISILAIFTYTI